MPLTFKAYRIEEDRAFLFQAHRETSTITFGQPFSDDRTEAELNRDYSLRHGLYYQGKIIGICDLDLRSDKLGEIFCNVSFLYLAVEYRGLGVAGKLLQHAVKWAKDQNCKRLLLRTGESNLSARKAYERNGFVRDASRDGKGQLGYEMTITY